MSTGPSRTFSTALRAFRASRKITGAALAQLADIPPRSISRWERQGVRPRAAEARKVIAAIATMDHSHALELANILGLAPPPAPAPPPEPTVIAAPPVPEPPPPIPDDLAIDPMEVAVFRAAEALGIVPTPLRPVLARFLGHVAALGLTAAEAQQRLG